MCTASRVGREASFCTTSSGFHHDAGADDSGLVSRTATMHMDLSSSGSRASLSKSRVMEVRCRKLWLWAVKVSVSYCAVVSLKPH